MADTILSSAECLRQETAVQPARYDLIIDGRIHTTGLTQAEFRELLAQLSFDPATLIRKLKAKGHVIISDEAGTIRVERRHRR
jgi:hypothetical protein